MNKHQIKAELRRSACEDENPWASGGLASWAENYACEFIQENEWISDLSNDNCRIFFLLVAESL